MKKHRFKEFFKKKKAWIIGTGIFLLVGVVLMLVGFSLTGFNIIDWFNSPYFVTCMVVVAVFLLLLMYLLIEMARIKAGHDDDDNDIFKGK